MPAKYFQNFDTVLYNDYLAINIMERTAILNKVVSDRYAFYPYTVKNAMRADQVAERYYGSPHYMWLVYMSNNIIDPYYQWVMDPETFKDYIIKKYGSLYTAQNTIVKYRVNWYEDSTILSVSQFNALDGYKKKYWIANLDQYDNPMNYVRKQIDTVAVAKDDEGVITNPITANEQIYWSSVSAYDEEEELNNEKAHIRLLDSNLASVAEKNLKELMKN